jgi:hypothetical protein
LMRHLLLPSSEKIQVNAPELRPGGQEVENRGTRRHFDSWSVRAFEAIRNRTHCIEIGNAVN